MLPSWRIGMTSLSLNSRQSLSTATEAAVVFLMCQNVICRERRGSCVLVCTPLRWHGNSHNRCLEIQCRKALP